MVYSEIGRVTLCTYKGLANPTCIGGAGSVSGKLWLCKHSAASAAHLGRITLFFFLPLPAPSAAWAGAGAEAGALAEAAVELLAVTGSRSDAAVACFSRPIRFNEGSTWEQQIVVAGMRIS